MSILISLELQRDNFQLSLHTAINSVGFTAIYGPSGSGKTSLLRWIAGLEKSLTGHLNFKQSVWQDDKEFVPTRLRQIAYVFQDARLFPHLNVHGNLQFAYKRRFNDNGPTIDQVVEWFEISHLLQRNTGALSGGEKQRVAMARALVSSPQLILMDEPLGSLDEQSKKRILNHLEKLHQHLPIPVLYVSHDIEEVSRLADQILLLHQGKLVAQGSLIELSSRLDISLSQEENAASIICATVAQHDEHYQLTQLSIDQQQPLWITRIDKPPGQSVRLRIPAKDVSIALNKPEQTSILNIIPGTIDEIEPTDSARMIVRLKIAEQFLLAKLTHKSVDRLQLHTGQQVFAQIKTAALLSETDFNHSPGRKTD